jgi:AcrR family transcriptional regulator
MLDAAAELFSKRGFHTTTVAEICERADVARKTFFNHFQTKRHVLRELASASVEQLVLDIEAVRKEEDDTRQGLLAFFAQVAQNLAESGPMSREFASEVIHSVEEAGEEAENTRRLHAAFGEIVRDGLARRDVTRRHDPELCTEMIIAVYHQLILNWVHLDGYPIEPRARDAARFLADALAPVPGEE